MHMDGPYACEKYTSMAWNINTSKMSDQVLLTIQHLQVSKQMRD